MRVSSAELEEYGLKEGDLLVNRVNSRELVGKAAFIPPSLEPSVFESKNIRVRLDESKALPKFINYQLLAGSRRHFAGNAQQVVGMASISQRQLADFPIVLADLEEQRRIVAEIEKQFSRLDQALAHLARARTNLERCEAAVLGAADQGRLAVKNQATVKVSGTKLLEEIRTLRKQRWRDLFGSMETRKYKEPRAATITVPITIPARWAVASLEELTPADRPCAYGVLQPGGEVSEGVRLVRVGDISEGRVHMSGLKRINPSIAARYPRTALKGGELLITLVGSIGRAAIVPEELHGANVARAVAVIPLTDSVDQRWISIWLQSPAVRAHLEGAAHEVARKTLNLEDVRRMPVALPPLQEQREIVEATEVQLSRVRHALSDIDAEETKGTRLRASVLNSAFQLASSFR
jgi:type I restriction enzyme S subunit